jgi:hypothetical protein
MENKEEETFCPTTCFVCLQPMMQEKRKIKRFGHVKCIKVHKRFDKAFERFTECQYDLVMLSK